MSKDVIKLDQLIRIAEDVPWETFEAMLNGRLLLQDRAQTLVPDEEDTSPLLWVFEMRVGLHFERPMQAIMSCGQFIRMRSAPMYESCTLGKLDPERPEACLYQYPTSTLQQQISSTAFTATWRPTPSYPAWVQGQQNLQGTSGQLIGSGGGGGGSGTAGTTVWVGPNQTVTTTNTSAPLQGTLSRLAGALGVKI